MLQKVLTVILFVSAGIGCAIGAIYDFWAAITFAKGDEM